MNKTTPTTNRKNLKLGLIKKDPIQLNIEQTIKNLNDKIEEIQLETTKPKLTNGDFNFNNAQGSTSVKIGSETRIDMLVMVMGFLIQKANEYNTGAKALGLRTIKLFNWCGYPLEAWENDINLQLAIITNHEKLTKITAHRDFLVSKLSEDTQILAALLEAEKMLM